MTSKFNRRVNGLKAKGFSRAGAVRHLREMKAAMQPSNESWLSIASRLDKKLGAIQTGSIVLREEKAGIKAVFGKKSLKLTDAEHQALRSAGATIEGKPQVIHALWRGFTVSVPCCSCQRWIWSGNVNVDHVGACFCGQPHEVVFDSMDSNLPMGPKCMDCGADAAGSPAWSFVNRGQVVCATCRKPEHPHVDGPADRDLLTLQKVPGPRQTINEDVAKTFSKVVDSMSISRMADSMKRATAPKFADGFSNLMEKIEAPFKAFRALDRVLAPMRTIEKLLAPVTAIEKVMKPFDEISKASRRTESLEKVVPIDDVTKAARSFHGLTKAMPVADLAKAAGGVDDLMKAMPIDEVARAAKKLKGK